MSVLKALAVSGVPAEVAGDILASLGPGADPETPEGLEAVRTKFRAYNMQVMKLIASKSTLCIKLR